MTQSSAPATQTAWIRDALERLGVDHLALILFDAAIPQHEDWDIGVGGPYSERARDLLSFAQELGFTGIQFGPQGAISREYASPYDGTALSRNPLSIALDEIAHTEVFEGITPLKENGPFQHEVRSILQESPPSMELRAEHSLAFDRQRKILKHVTSTLIEATRGEEHSHLRQRFQDFRQENQEWLFADTLYEILCEEYGVGDHEYFPRSWDGERDRRVWHNDWHSPVAGDASLSLLGYTLPAAQLARLQSLARLHAVRLEEYAWVQFIASEQHERLKRWAQSTGLELYGDLHVGYSRRDLWHFDSVFLEDYYIGAPPSRTNREGQPWGYPVLSPALLKDTSGGLGPALKLLELRVKKLFTDYDRVRIDHPHGLVCPWVYKRNEEPFHAVQHGARLYSSPNLPDHPKLAQFTLVEESALDTSLPRHADGWIRKLSPEQVRRFSTCFDVLAQSAQELDGTDRLVCEVLSTQPNELGAVLEAHSLGRFRVTQKANLHDDADVYRSENARPEDWMLMGNHDTLPMLAVIERWTQQGKIEEHAQYLATRLAKDEHQQRALSEHFQTGPNVMLHAQCADLFASNARNVIISFNDLFGITEPYNVPGTLSADNWSQRLPRDFRAAYRKGVEEGRALDLRKALELALSSRAQ